MRLEVRPDDGRHAGVDEHLRRVAHRAPQQRERVRAVLVDVGVEQRAHLGTDLRPGTLTGSDGGVTHTVVEAPGVRDRESRDRALDPSWKSGLDGVGQGTSDSGKRRSVFVLVVARHARHAPSSVEPERIEPGPGQESVWDYPRPPALEANTRHLRVELAGTVVADTTRGWRICETSQPPAYYVPPDDVRLDLLDGSLHHTFCEWKGQASYRTVRVGEHVVKDAAWLYERPVERYAVLRDHIAFYPQRLECFVDGERVSGNEGAFYGGWITSFVVGPFKGGPGTAGW